MNKHRRLTSQDLSWFLDLYNNDQLDLDPPYQRKSIWSLKERRFFLDTIFRSFPSPTIFLHKEVSEGGQTQYAVVDGKQRLETVIMFVKDKIAIDKAYGDTRLNGKKWSEIKENSELRLQFSDYTVPVEFIRVDPSQDYVNQVFDRINRNSKKLTRQELRHAKYDGWFISFAENEATEPTWEKLHVVTTTKAKRMADVQFLSELLMVVMKKKVSGFDQDEIDRFYANFDVPAESEIKEVSFDEQNITKTFRNSREIILKIEEENGSVSSFTRSAKDFYTFWLFVVLNFSEIIGRESKIAEKYKGFMEKVKQITEAEVVNEKEVDKDALQYARNNVGASTELPQREKRIEALKNALLNV